MNKILLAFLLLFSSAYSFGQQFSQYNTGSVYDSFENPAQRSFIPDSSRKFAFNFFLPNFGSDFYLTGNSQVGLKSRAFLGYYAANDLTVGENKFNRAHANANIYWGMLKIFTNLEGSAEVGISAQTKAEGRANFSDESAVLYNGLQGFPADQYNNIFNDDAVYQTYHQISFTYREKVTKNIAVGVKLSTLLGIQYQKLDVNESSLQIDRANDAAIIGLRGTYKNNYIPGTFTMHDYLPTLRNPGASITLGTAIDTRDRFHLQFNVKDLGFIRWSSRSHSYNFNAQDTAFAMSTSRRERNLYEAEKNITHTNQVTGSFITPTNARIEASANKTFSLDYQNKLRYSPTLVLSKELFYSTYTAALVNPIMYNNLSVTLTQSFDSYKTFHFGGQFMVKSPNAEFYIGSDRLLPTARTVMAAGKSNTQINYRGAYTGASVFMGVSFKFGSPIEHPMNASFIPLEDKKGFFVRLWNKIFKKTED